MREEVQGAKSRYGEDSSRVCVDDLGWHAEV